MCTERIKKHQVYYHTTPDTTSVVANEVTPVKTLYCHKCYTENKKGSFDVDGKQIPKASLLKKKNEEEIEEAWVECDKCEKWFHQVCALFNGRQNEGGDVSFTCPQCCLDGIEAGKRKPLVARPKSLKGASDLSHTKLSKFLEERLTQSLKRERGAMAKKQGIAESEVPTVSCPGDLSIRVVSSVDKKVDTKERFAKTFGGEGFPTGGFPYRSKAVLLFKTIDGVDVILFAMYVHEFDAKCPSPNTRRIYLSYIDSVKYFAPERASAFGGALRTFVYHDIIIGYLDYARARGFTSMYIWACPPMQGEDYILYVHPQRQKTPRADKLREWYMTMLRRACEERIVHSVTNIHDSLFLRKPSDAPGKLQSIHLPYFEGDYFPGAFEELIGVVESEMAASESQQPASKKATAKKGKGGSKKAGAKSEEERERTVAKDEMLMKKLKDIISPMKSDFILVNLRPECSSCGAYVEGTSYVCPPVGSSLVKAAPVWARACLLTDTAVTGRTHRGSTRDLEAALPAVRRWPLAGSQV